MPPQTIRLVIADGHPLFRQGLVHILEGVPDFAVAAVAASGGDALRLARELLPDVILLGPFMPEGGLTACCRIKAAVASAAVVLLTMDEDGQYREQALRAGADGYLTRGADAARLAGTIRMAATARAASFRPDLFGQANPDEESRSPGLTERELEVLQFLGSGASNRDLAAALGISEKTAKNHLTRIFEKLGVSDRTQAALFAVRTGLVRLEEEGRQRVASSRSRAYTVS